MPESGPRNDERTGSGEHGPQMDGEGIENESWGMTGSLRGTGKLALAGGCTSARQLWT